MKKIVIAIGAFIIIIPIILISYISYLEMKKYEPKINYKIEEKSYGNPTPILRTTIDEKFSIKGKFTSTSFAFVDIKNQNFENTKTVVAVNDEVKKGEVLAYIKDKPIYSNVNGIVSEIDVMKQNGNFKILNLDKLLLECYMDPKLKLIENTTYTANDNIKIKLVSLSNIVDDFGRRAYFQVEGGNYVFGQKIEFQVLTGVVHKDILATDKNCVYQKEKAGPYFIRRVDKSGKVIGEVEVKVGLTDNKMISISGAEEGWFCDPGYGKFMNANLEGAK